MLSLGVQGAALHAAHAQVHLRSLSAARTRDRDAACPRARPRRVRLRVPSPRSQSAHFSRARSNPGAARGIAGVSLPDVTRGRRRSVPLGASGFRPSPRGLQLPGRSRLPRTRGATVAGQPPLRLPLEVGRRKRPGLRGRHGCTAGLRPCGAAGPRAARSRAVPDDSRESAPGQAPTPAGVLRAICHLLHFLGSSFPSWIRMKPE